MYILLRFRLCSQKILRQSSSLKVGIVGMANIGKSSTYNLISGLQVPAQNVPFCTIKPNVSIVRVKDKAFQKLVKLYNPIKLSPSTLQIMDIAGLVKGASQGFGLGNQFLSNIKQVDAIFHTVRCFQGQQIIHTQGKYDPIRDIQIVGHQLCAKDVKQASKKRNDLVDKYNRKRQQDLKFQIDILQVVVSLLKKDVPIRKHIWKQKQIQILRKHNFLTGKPTLFLLNCTSNKKQSANSAIQFLTKNKQHYFVYSVQQQQQYQLQKGHPSQNIDLLITKGFQLLDSIRFFTVGKDQVKSWQLRKGKKANQAAGLIHGELQKGFICAYVLNQKQIPQKSFQKHKKKQNKDYVVKDGDIIIFQSKFKR